MAEKKLNFVKTKIVMAMHGIYNLILGERGNGKSYSTKLGIIKYCYENKKEFAYLRRYAEDCKDSMCSPYFADVPVSALTDGKYSCITVYRKDIFLCNVSDDRKIVRGQKIGSCFALSASEHYKSLMFPLIDFMVYEEFITDGYYLANEPDKLQNLVSTIFRHRKGKVYLIGNKISRICPYYSEWSLTRIPKQKEGTIEDYHIKQDEEDICISVYMTHSLNSNSGMFFGNSAKAITKGAWHSDIHPHLTGDIDDYEIIYTIVAEYQSNKFLMQFMQNRQKRDEYTWYVQPKTTPIQKDTRVISDHYNESYLYTQSFQPLTEGERNIFHFLDLGKICFSDNLTGTEYHQCIDMLLEK